MANHLAGELGADAKAHLRTVNLQLTERKFLEFVAQRGGELPFNFTQARPDASAMVKGIILKGLLVVSETSTGRPSVRLTDQGRQVMQQIEIQNRAHGAGGLVSSGR